MNDSYNAKIVVNVEQYNFKNFHCMQTHQNTNSASKNVTPARTASTPKQKYYSSDDVNKIVRNAFQPKIQFLMHELEQRQQTIAKLNNKLNENDEKLLEQSSLIDNYIKKQKEIPHVQSYIHNTISQIINEKTKQYWEAIASKIGQIGAKVQEKFDQKRLEELIQGEMERLKQAVTQFMDYNKNKSNSYWQKIKDALNKINAKIVRNEKDIMDINLKLQNVQAQRSKDREIVSELQNSKNVVKNLIELKRSVGNIYENYQVILSLQKGLKQRIEERSGDSIWHEVDFYQDQGNMLPCSDVVLDYSKEERPQHDDKLKIEVLPKQDVSHPAISPIKSSADKSLTSDPQVQRTNPLGKSSEYSELFSLDASQYQFNSRFQNNTLLINQSLQTRKEMCLGVKERLMELIEAKHWQRPLQIRYDEQINYLKSVQGNYLFDLKGNMFKISINDLTKLEEENIVIRNKRRDLSSSKAKITQC